MTGIEGYRIYRELGRSGDRAGDAPRTSGAPGDARVYLATERQSNRPMALKVIELGDDADLLARDRAWRRARRVARLDHPNAVKVYDVGLEGSALYVAMEHLQGGDLSARLRAGVSFVDILRITEQLANALDHAHAKGCLHGDVTPSNILFRDPGAAVLVDFAGGALGDLDPGSAPGRVRVVGTPGYMSPEQAAGRGCDARSDLYGLGVVFFQMLTGDTPHPPEHEGGTVIRHPAAAAPRLPERFAALQELVDGLLAPLPEKRFQSGAEVVRALDAVRFEDVTPQPALVRALVATSEIEVLAAAMEPRRDGGRTRLD
ncbi:MAG: serine/threonine-protein kinase, partial [Gammaproteobacteria bacterium]|nr:serine/threonine-protein kinase [Gammaproteobacteria bacterium]